MCMQIFTSSVSKYNLVLNCALSFDQIIPSSAGMKFPATLNSKKVTMVIHQDATFPSPAAPYHDAPSTQVIVPPLWINNLAVRRLMNSVCLAKGRKARQMAEKSPSVLVIIDMTMDLPRRINHGPVRLLPTYWWPCERTLSRANSKFVRNAVLWNITARNVRKGVGKNLINNGVQKIK